LSCIPTSSLIAWIWRGLEPEARGLGVARGDAAFAVPDQQSDQRTLWQLEVLDSGAGQLALRRNIDGQQVGMMLLQGRGVHTDLAGRTVVGDAKAAGQPGQEGALDQGEDDDQHEDDVEQPLRAR
jgi:hypothetical protein